MATIKRLAVYLFLFVVLLSIVASLPDFWQSLDYFVYKTFYLDDSKNIELSEDIILVDIPHKTGNKSIFDRGDYRKRLSNLLDSIGAHQDSNDKPDAVILDIYFKSETEGLETLKSALKRLKEKNVKVYGVYDMTEYERTIFEKNEELQAVEIYDNYLQGNRLHTIFEQKRGVLYYQSELKFPTKNGGYAFIESVASRVARDIGKKSASLTNESRGYILPLGDENSIESQTYQFTQLGDSVSGGKFSADFIMNDKILIVGSLEADYLDTWEKTGTHLVAWALFDQLNSNTLAKQPLNKPWVILGLIVFFAFFTALVFALLFKYVKSLQTKPLVIAVISCLISTAFLLGVGAAISAMGNVLPMGLALMGILLASILSWRFAYKFLVTGIAPGSEKYDVFISYSHGNSDWVVKNIFEPLKDFRKPDGDKLKIFFDTKSIGIGEAFTSKYMWGIVDSKVFIPIISEEYYGKNHCRNEMDLAYKRSVEKLLDILPIVFSYESVPEIYTHINFLDITVNPNFMEAVQKTLNEMDEKGVGNR